VARLGRRQVGVWTSRVSPIVLAVQFAADVPGDSTASATVTAARSDVGAVTGASTASATLTAATAVTVDLAGAVTAAGVVDGVANIPSIRINRAPFGRT
jgi:hypothetical protein